MSTTDYEEGYFKMKRSNEELTTLINTVINDLQQIKAQLKTEQEKNSNLTQRNVLLEKEFDELTAKCESYAHQVEDLTDEISYLQSLSKAVEGIAENYVEKNIITEAKYTDLKRKSTMILDKLTEETYQEINFPDMDEVDYKTPTTSTSNNSELEELNKVYELKIAHERSKRKVQRRENKKMKQEMEEMNKKIEGLTSQVEEHRQVLEKTYIDLETITSSYEALKADHDSILDYFIPFLKMKADNLELKRTSAILINESCNDARILEFMRDVNDLKKENFEKDLKIKELESRVDTTDLVLEISDLKFQLEDALERIRLAVKEKDSLEHENRILQEQKGGPDIPPPPTPPPLPPQPPSNLVIRLFGKSLKTPQKVIINKIEDKIVVDMMKELEGILKGRVKEKIMKKLPIQTSLDISDSPVHTRTLRSGSVPAIRPLNEESMSELNRVWIKRKVLLIKDEN